MANSDYILRGEGGFSPYGLLNVALTPDAGVIDITGYQGVSVSGDLEVGMGVMIGDEILRLKTTSLPYLQVARGCADTIPALHLVNTPVWFFSNNAVSDEREYTALDPVAVKVLPYSLSDGPVPVEGAPPLDLVFNWRFARPYAPGLMTCQGLPWYSQIFVLEDVDTEYLFEWKHRDRILQGDQLIGHEEDNIGPEPGVTYTARVYDRDDVLAETVAGITDNFWSYSKVDATAAVPFGTGRVEISAVRDTFESWQIYSILIQPGEAGGLGEALGEALGG